MGDIYRALNKVVIWLGVQDDQADEDIRICSLMATMPLKQWRRPRHTDNEGDYAELRIPYMI